ncbi:MAG TPA: hypothetical protein VMP01_20825 [Pirellulaceae bacterium]|nr:hypothetical protein [Pirellulaceae bacterium]
MKTAGILILVLGLILVIAGIGMVVGSVFMVQSAFQGMMESRVPAQTTQSTTGGFGVAITSLRTSGLRPADFVGGLGEQLTRGAAVKPQGPHHRTDRSVHLADGQPAAVAELLSLAIGERDPWAKHLRLYRPTSWSCTKSW